MSDPKQMVVVLGMHRSGTSSVAGTFVRLGAVVPRDVLPPQPDNPSGFYESRAIVQLNDEILAALGSHWKDWRPLAPGWRETESGRRFRERAIDLVRTEFEAAPLAVAKDPRLCRLLPFWCEAFRGAGYEPLVVIPLRSPVEVAQSILKRNQLPVSRTLLLWLRYVIDAERDSRGLRRAFTHWPSFLGDWRSEVGRVVGELDMALPTPSEAMEAAVDAFLDGSMRHHHAPEDPPDIGAWAAETEAALRTLAASGPTDAIRDRLDAIDAELSRASQVFGPWTGAIDGGAAPAAPVVRATDEPARATEAPAQGDLQAGVVASTTADRPLLSIVIVFHDMRREAERTLHTLSSAYQRDACPESYEVIAVDNGSTVPLDPAFVERFGPNFRLLRRDPGNASPAAALNAGVGLARGDAVMLCIDGARMLSPGIVRFTQLALRVRPNPVVATLAWHLGPKLQNESMLDGYGPETEDRLLESADWRTDGYELFRLSTIAGSCRDGWFHPIAESNCLTLSRSAYARLGGFDERFVAPGGGLVALDFYRRAVEEAGDLVVLLGEGTFHQFHGGVATNVPPSRHPWAEFHDEYVALRGSPYEKPTRPALYLGSLPPQGLRFVAPARTPADKGTQTDPTSDRPATRPGRRTTRSALFVSCNPGAHGHVYRVLHPVEALQEAGWRARWARLDDPELPRLAAEADIVVVWRTPWQPALAALYEACAAARVPLGFDIDDLVFEPDLMRAGYFDHLRRLPEPEREEWFSRAALQQESLRRADFALLSTASLSDAACAFCRSTFVLPNAISPAMADAAATARDRRPGDRGVTQIGFASGSPTHQRDFAAAASAVARALDRHASARLTILGCLDLDEFPILAPHAARIECRPAVPLAELAEEIVRFDINLAPLELANRFCEAKSEIRFTAAAMVEVPTIATPTQPLRDAIRHGCDGLLAEDEAGWDAALERLLTDADGRRAIGRAARHRTDALFGWASYTQHIDSLFKRIVDDAQARD